MFQLAFLKGAQSIHDVAFLLEFQTKALAYILYKKPPESKYRSFTIAKRAGGTREINAPSEDLMLLQKRLSDLLQESAREINVERKWEDELAHGFKRKRSIISNASKHLKRRYVLNMICKTSLEVSTSAGFADFSSRTGTLRSNQPWQPFSPRLRATITLCRRAVHVHRSFPT